MTLKELDQFLVDPIIDDDAKILVNQIWLQKHLRRLEELEREYPKREQEKRDLLDSNSNLRRDIMLCESKQPYTVLNVKV